MSINKNDNEGLGGLIWGLKEIGANILSNAAAEYGKSVASMTAHLYKALLEEGFDNTTALDTARHYITEQMRTTAYI